MAHLSGYRRYPAEAKRRRIEGVATVRLRIDRDGRVLAVSLEESSGVRVLDEEAVALVHRASPLPHMPTEMAGAALEIVVPIQFSLRRL